MLKVLMEFRKGILFVRLYGDFSESEINVFNNEVKEVILKAGILYVVLNTYNLNSISKEGVQEIKKLRKIMKKTKGELFVYGGTLNELKSLVNLENELKVFERVMI